MDLRPDRQLMRRILRIGVPGGVDVSAIIGCQMWYLALVNGLGPLAAACHGIAIRIESIAYLPGTGFQVAAGTLAGQHLGAGDRKGANRSVVLATIVGLIVISAGGIILYTAANPLARAFLRPAEYEVARTAAPLLQTVALVMPALALMMILTGALRGAGDTRWPLLFTLIGFLAVRIPATYGADRMVDAGRARRVVRDGPRHRRPVPASRLSLLARRFRACRCESARSDPNRSGPENLNVGSASADAAA